jgi:ppGpp synthetase/RelA/SpoT-type nucleotidyltranferase
MPLTDEQIVECQERYLREFDRYSKMADTVYEKCLEIVQKKLTVRATVQRRAKNPKSFVEKLKKVTMRERFHSVDDVFDRISDLAGVRIATYLESDRNTVVEEIRKEFSGRVEGIPEIDVKDKGEVGRHYKATHCQVLLLEDELVAPNENLRGTTCEIQVCSLLAHVFNEVEHDLQYKPLTGDLSEQEKEFIDQLGLLTKAGDITIKRLLHEAENRLQGRTGVFADVYDFIARMRVEMRLAEGFAANAGQLFDELLLLKINTPDAISQAVCKGEAKPLYEIADAEYARLKEFMVQDQRQADLLEDGSSDVLLVGILRSHLAQVLKNHPMGRGVGRPSRLAQIASWYRRMQDA